MTFCSPFFNLTTEPKGNNSILATPILVVILQRNITHFRKDTFILINFSYTLLLTKNRSQSIYKATYSISYRFNTLFHCICNIFTNICDSVVNLFTIIINGVKQCITYGCYNNTTSKANRATYNCSYTREYRTYSRTRYSTTNTYTYMCTRFNCSITDIFSFCCHGNKVNCTSNNRHAKLSNL